jgi:hypothetical protein
MEFLLPTRMMRERMTAMKIKHFFVICHPAILATNIISV